MSEGTREEAHLELGEKTLASRILLKAAYIAKRFWWLGIFLFLTLWALLNPTVMNLALLGLSFVWQLVFAVLFMVVQFGALFWFMGRTKTVVIKPVIRRRSPSMITGASPIWWS